MIKKGEAKMKLKEIASLIGGELLGNGEILIEKMAPIEIAGPSEIALVAEARFFRYLQTSRAGAVIVPPQAPLPPSIPAIRVREPYLAWKKLAEKFSPPLLPFSGIHSTVVIGKNCRLGKDVSIGPFVFIDEEVEIDKGVVIYPFVFIGRGVKIGAQSKIYANVSIRENCLIGREVIIHPNACIGSDGFGYGQVNQEPVKIPQLGRVVIGDEVEIGAGTTIDRGTLGETRIGDKTKIDNLVQIAHNVIIGANCLIAGLVGIAGSVKIGQGVRIGGQAGIADHCQIGDGAIIGAQAGVTKNVPAQTAVSGYPARPHREALKVEACQHQLPHLIKKIKLTLRR